MKFAHVHARASIAHHAALGFRKFTSAASSSATEPIPDFMRRSGVEKAPALIIISLEA